MTTRQRKTLDVTPERYTPPFPLETVFSPGHQYHTRVFYDRVEGQYYDRSTDLYLSLDEARAMGIAC